VGREAWSAMFVVFGLVDVGFLMTINGALADSSPEAVSRICSRVCCCSKPTVADGAVPRRSVAADDHLGRQRVSVVVPCPGGADRQRQAPARAGFSQK